MNRKKQIIYPLLIIVVGVGLFIGFKSLKKPPEEKPKDKTVLSVDVSPMLVDEMQIEVDSYGLVNGRYETELVSQISGQIVELSPIFLQGNFVKKGQLLARIDPNDYEANLIDAQASLASAKAAFEQERAKGKVAREEWDDITGSIPTELSLRKPQLAQEMARVKAAEAAVKRATRNLERTQIVAPYDALIESRKIGLGAFVSPGFNLGKVVSTSVAEIRLPIADSQLKYLLNGGRGADVVLEGDYAGSKQVWQGTIVRSEGIIDKQSRMTYLVAAIDDPYSLSGNGAILRFGSYVKAKVKGIIIKNATKVPRHLIVNKQIPILAEDNTLVYRTIDIVKEEGRDVIVSSGLSNGERLIVSALESPIEGMALSLLSDEIIKDESTSSDLETQSAKEAP